MSEAGNAGEEPWIAQFDKEISSWGERTFEYALAMMLKDFLLSDSDSTTADTARRTDNFDEQEFLPSDPLLRFEEDQRMGGFLSSFYDVVFTLARLIPYNSSKQEKLVLLILELRKLPPRQSKSWEEDCLMWTREPVFAVIMEDNWNGNHPSDAKERGGGDGEHSFQEVCDEWVNFSCFLARCIEAGLTGGNDNRCKYPSIDISQGLEQDLPPGLKRDCKVTVAAQYILLAGRTLARDVEQLDSGFGPDQWRRWAEKLEEISSQEGGNTRLASAIEEARRYLVSLHPELFPASEDG